MLYLFDVLYFRWGERFLDVVIVRCVMFSMGWKIFMNVIFVRCVRFSMGWKISFGCYNCSMQ